MTFISKKFHEKVLEGNTSPTIISRTKLFDLIRWKFQIRYEFCLLMKASSMAQKTFFFFHSKNWMQKDILLVYRRIKFKTYVRMWNLPNITYIFFTFYSTKMHDRVVNSENWYLFKAQFILNDVVVVNICIGNGNFSRLIGAITKDLVEITMTLLIKVKTIKRIFHTIHVYRYFNKYAPLLRRCSLKK